MWSRNDVLLKADLLHFIDSALNLDMSAGEEICVVGEGWEDMEGNEHEKERWQYTREERDGQSGQTNVR